MLGLLCLGKGIVPLVVSTWRFLQQLLYLGLFPFCCCCSFLVIKLCFNPSILSLSPFLPSFPHPTGDRETERLRGVEVVLG